MIFTWLKRRRRRNLLAQSIPDEWERVLRENVWQFAALDDAGRQRLRDAVQIFIHEKHWEGCAGQEITDEVRVTIAGMACLLLLGFEEEYFNRLRSVLVYPAEYLAPETVPMGPGVGIETVTGRLGEAWSQGPVVLSWSTVLEDVHGPRRGGNVVVHEFAHVLDMSDLSANGTPPLGSDAEYRAWRDVMTAEFRRLHRDARRGRTLLDQYGTTNEAEFFAVATECFFEKPQEMSRQLPQLYGLLRGYYRQDPAAWSVK